jgi:hypothetical protein
MEFDKAVTHKVPTYDEMVKETITHPTNNLALPDRMEAYHN